ncbi:RNA polymerase sigma factor [Nisaea acidiphila]|uniref:RNA polymerase sigma factor n=1 Tax=Nisaea acidiphila TaxID=1862145 RepID=A0A9J7AU22_9PROT|nr:RNA polymerase sigma factor [Nisaea acidiphila]UUX48885.1 RNA polymerase sigma factor [Nisaea acidiphila]
MHETALLRAYREHEQELVSYLARRLNSFSTARDLAHDLYLKLHDQKPAEITHEKAYLFRMASNLAVDHQRRTTRQSALAAEAQSILSARREERTPERTAAARQELKAMRAAIADLPEQSCRIFQMNRFEGKSQREIAETLGVSTTTVENHIRKVLERLTAARNGSFRSRT